jgi:hypothetical protein
MIHDDSNRRPRLIQQLIEQFFSSLASCSESQLESLLRVQQLTARPTTDADETDEEQAPEEAPALVLISPEATKDETTVALQRLAHWLQINWEEVVREREDTGSVVVEPPSGLPPDLLN